MNEDSTKALSKVIRIDESEIRSHLDKMVRGTVEDALNAMLDAEADEMCNAQRYERSPDRVDTRAGHYTRKLHTKAGEVEVKCVFQTKPATDSTAKLPPIPFESCHRFR